MGEIAYITESTVKYLIQSEVESNPEHIHNQIGFAQHLIDTGNIAYQVATKILEKHPSLHHHIHPGIVRLAGYLHDFSKIYEGDFYHEIGTAHLIVQEGDKKLELITGGTLSERKELLKATASILPPDALLYEELGGNDYPQAAIHDCFPEFHERTEYLRRALSQKGILTIEQLALPYTLDQQIGLYADFTNVNGKIISPEERIKELEIRYNDPNSPYYNPFFNNLRRKAIPRILTVTKVIDTLLS